MFVFDSGIVRICRRHRHRGPGLYPSSWTRNLVAWKDAWQWVYYRIDTCDDDLRLFGTNGVIRLVGTESSSQSVIASFSVRSSSPGKTLKLWRASVIHLCRSLCDSSCIVMPMLAGALKATSLGYKQRLHHASTRQETFNLGVMCCQGYGVIIMTCIVFLVLIGK